MKVAVLGGGLAGMTAAYEINKKGHKVILFEKEEVLGGLAAGFKEKNWNWSLEKNIHHLFSNDRDIINFSNELGFKNILFKSTKSGSYYGIPANITHLNRTPLRSKSIGASEGQVLALDTPQDLLTFPYLDLFSKIRTAIVIVLLKLSPFFPKLYERSTAERFIKFTMGKKSWDYLWKGLFRKKFGKYAGIILASFFWARITKRTKKLGYFQGGFNNFINHMESQLFLAGVEIKTSTKIETIEKLEDSYLIKNQEFDCVISTLPTPILIKLTGKIFPSKYLNSFKKIKYMHAISLVLQTKELILDDFYWINILDPKNEIMGIVQHTNFMDKSNYNDNHIIYVYNYFPVDDKKIRYSKEKIYNFYIKNLEQIDPKIKNKIKKYNIFFGPYAQPVFDKNFIENRPDFKTPAKNFYIANLDMTYPYDRGTNYAVKLGKEVAKRI